MNENARKNSDGWELSDIEIYQDGFWINGDILCVRDCINYYSLNEKNSRKFTFFKLIEEKLMLLAKLKDVEQNIQKVELDVSRTPLDKYYALKIHIKRKHEIVCKQQLNEFKFSIFKSDKSMDFDPDQKEIYSKDETDV